MFSPWLVLSLLFAHTVTLASGMSRLLEAVKADANVAGLSLVLLGAGPLIMRAIGLYPLIAERQVGS